MTNVITQFNLQFDAAEDRLCLRVLSSDNAEVGIWLTRRYVKLLLKTLGKQLNDKELAAVKNWEQTRHQEQAVIPGEPSQPAPTGPRFDDQYLATEETRRPLGDSPVLVTCITCHKKDTGHLALVLGQEQQSGVKVEFSLTKDLVQNLTQMLLEAALAAEWELSVAPIEDEVALAKGAVLH